MSFSGKVKEELAGNISPARHCRIAELAAFIGMCGTVVINSFDRYSIKIHTENLLVARKVFTLIEKTFNIKADASVRRNISKQTVSYAVVIRRHEDALRILQATKMTEEYEDNGESIHAVDPLIVQQTCCKRAFLRGAFQASGSMSDPNKSYHFEIVCSTEEMGKQVCTLMRSFSMDAKTVLRKKSYVVYLKEGSQIVDFLGVVEAGSALMNLENIRIRKEISNNINRKVNCETANIGKTVSAAVKQIEDIRYIETHVGFSQLTEELEETAVCRLRYPEATLKELGEMMNPPVGKSGVNHRLRKLGRIADELRGNKEDYND